jgi:hypothetical protein
MNWSAFMQGLKVEINSTFEKNLDKSGFANLGGKLRFHLNPLPPLMPSAPSGIKLASVLFTRSRDLEVGWCRADFEEQGWGLLGAANKVLQRLVPGLHCMRIPDAHCSHKAHT